MSEAGSDHLGSAEQAVRLGAELRAARTRLGWELPHLAASLRIRQAYLEAIEGGRVADLPGGTYAQGCVRAYASALGLQGEEVARRFRAEAMETGQPQALRFPVPVPERGVPAGALMLLGLVLLGAAYGGWYFVSERRPARVEVVPPIPDRLVAPVSRPAPSPQVASMLPGTTAPAPAAVPPKPESAPPVAAASDAPKAVVANSPAAVPPPPVVAAPAPAAAPPPVVAGPPGVRIVVKATADVWLTIKQKGGPALVNKLLHAGDAVPVPADKTDLTLTTGNAGGTVIEVDGAPIPVSLGGSGMVRRDLPLDADALKAGKLPAPVAKVKVTP
jgi:cytoskeleton protein RodZ